MEKTKLIGSIDTFLENLNADQLRQVLIISEIMYRLNDQDRRLERLEDRFDNLRNSLRSEY